MKSVIIHRPQREAQGVNDKVAAVAVGGCCYLDDNTRAGYGNPASAAMTGLPVPVIVSSLRLSMFLPNLLGDYVVANR